MPTVPAKGQFKGPQMLMYHAQPRKATREPFFLGLTSDQTAPTALYNSIYMLVPRHARPIASIQYSQHADSATLNSNLSRNTRDKSHQYACTGSLVHNFGEVDLRRLLRGRAQLGWIAARSSAPCPVLSRPRTEYGVFCQTQAI